MKLSDVAGRRLKILSYHGGCSTCPRRRIDYVPATLPINTQLIACGEAPGAVEVEDQEGFVGSSGQYMRNVFRQYGIVDFAVTNTIHCRPPGNKDPTTREVSCCMNMMTMEEVRGYPVVVLLGSIARSAFFPGVKGGKLLGNFAVHPDYPGQRFYTLWHPAFVGRRQDLKPRFEELVNRLAVYLKDGWIDKPEIITPDNPRFSDALLEVLSSRRVSLDLETNAKPLWDALFHVRSAAVCSDPSLVVAWHEEHTAFVGAMDRLGQWA